MKITNKPARAAYVSKRANPSRDRKGAEDAPLPLYPYQQRWVKDTSRFKIAIKATQIGYSFAAALEAVLDCLDHRTLWIVLSRGERQSLEFMQKVREHSKALRFSDSILKTSFFGETDILQHEVKFPNGSRIIGLPANPDTARGYTGNMILDEFAFHQWDREIWAAAFGRISRGDLKLRVLSTPNGQRGKYYEIAKEAGLTVGSPDKLVCLGHPLPNETAWSGHWCDVHAAVQQGCPIDVTALRRAIGDEETWRQEYECIFLSGSENYIPLDLIAACEHPQATSSMPPHWTASGDCYFGYRNQEPFFFRLFLLFPLRRGCLFQNRHSGFATRRRLFKTGGGLARRRRVPGCLGFQLD